MIDDGETTGSPGGALLSRPVRIAMAFIQEHAREQIRVVDIAAATGLSARGLQVAFHRELHATPMEYLRQIRLEGVHRELERSAPNDGGNVSEIARRWNFSNVGRLATAYRAAFGVSPGDTLRTGGRHAHRAEQSATRLSGADRARERFRLVIECDVDVTDADALLQTVSTELQRPGRAWNSYRPDGGTEDMVAFLFSRAIRHAVVDADGVALRSINPMVRDLIADDDEH